MNIIDLILPRVCHVCGKTLVGDERFICTICCSRLPRTLYHRYWGNTDSLNSDINPMEMRFAGLIPFVHATSAFFYAKDTHFAQLVQDFKYRKFPSLARHLGNIAARELLPTGFFTGIDVVIPIPIHWTKRMRRGYNQCEFIARGISEATGIPAGNQLRAARRHRTQTHLLREERLKNLKGVFKVVNQKEIDSKHILLVDDICTTGSTITAAASKIMEECPGAHLHILTLGVTY